MFSYSIGCVIVVFQFEVNVFKVDSELPRFLAAFLLGMLKHHPPYLQFSAILNPHSAGWLT